MRIICRFRFDYEEKKNRLVLKNYLINSLIQHRLIRLVMTCIVSSMSNVQSIVFNFFIGY